MTQAIISVIVPVYNVENYLSACIESIINQTFSDLEIILVNDGSTDRSGEICDEYARKDSRIKVIHKSNAGLSVARNTGLDVAQGSYILFVDSDDYINFDACEMLVKTALREQADIVQGKGIKFKEKNEIQVETGTGRISCYSNIDALEALFEYYDSDIRVVAWNKLFHKNLFKRLRFPNNLIYEDTYLIPRLFYEANKVVVVDYYTYYYRLSENSIMRSSFTLKKLDKLTVLKENLTFYREINEKNLYNKTLVIYAGSIMRAYFDVYRYNKNRQQLRMLKDEFNSIYGEAICLNNSNLKVKILLRLFMYSPLLFIVLIQIKEKKKMSEN